MSTVEIQKMVDSDSDTDKSNNKSTVDSVKTEKKDNVFIKFLEDNKLIIPLAVVGVATVGMAIYSFSKK
jgi:hypothetical protein